jgi:hypothetical protein
MKSYIIRIYRGEKDASRELLGTVERPGEEVKLAFTTFDELKDILGTHTGKDFFAEATVRQKDRKPNRGTFNAENNR